MDRYKIPQTWKSGDTVSLELFCPNGSNQDILNGEWDFPLYYQDGRFSLVLDGMMSARLRALLDARNTGSAIAQTTQKAFNTSITRLGEQIPALEALKEPRNIYAVIQGQCTYHGMEDDIREYSPSSSVKSNTENTLFADVEAGTEGGANPVQQVRITRFRHLSNIRYFDKNAAADFVLAGNMDWTASGGGVYDVVEKIVNPETGEKGYGISWEEVVRGERILDFPSIPLLSEKHTLTKKGSGARISNLQLGAGSVASDEWIAKLYQASGESGGAKGHYSNYLGLFCELEGRVEDILFQNPRVVLKGTDAQGKPKPVEDFAHIYGVGLLCGRCSGRVNGVEVKEVRKAGSAGTAQKTLEVYLADREPGNSEGETVEGGGANHKPAGIGGLIGVLAARDAATGELKQLTGADTGTGAIFLTDITMQGIVTGRLPSPEKVDLTEEAGYALAREADTADEGEKMDPVEKAAHVYRYGIGGIIGYAWVGENVVIQECGNSADVTGNLFTGGVCGNLTGGYVKNGGGSAGAGNPDDSGNGGTVSIDDCSNEGMVLCSTATTDEEGGNLPDMERSLEGRYFGGILGFGNQALIRNSVSASGRRADNPYTRDDRNRLQGWYVGGILGFGSDSLLLECGTKKGGYILGSDYVGGIAGGLSSNIEYAIKGNEGGAAVTTNECYVIGNRYVGGIVGKNDGTAETHSVIKDCVNNGAAVGYDRYIGGIVGYNGEYGELKDCASYISDYNNAIFNRIVDDWQAMGDCSGGLVGYNNGRISFEGHKIIVKSVANIAVGDNYVGGVIGFNDVKGTLDVAYTLIGGRVHASGDAVGGCIGLNASPGVLEQKLSIKPQSVQGRNFVGGVIGANVVDLPAREGAGNTGGSGEPETGSQNDNGKRVTAGRLETNSVLGSIQGEAFVGGVIGYHRTYTQNRLKEAAAAAGMTVDSKSALSVLDYLWHEEKASAEQRQAYQRLLPELTTGNIPGGVLQSGNDVVLRFTKAAKAETDTEWKEDSNNMSIRAYIYVGGIVGYCEQSSGLELVDCKNMGGISRPADPENGGSLPGAAAGVSLVPYLKQEAGISLNETEEKELGNLKVYMVGGMIGANLQNQVIDHCVNKGSMNGFVGLGGIVGFNAGGVFSCSLEDNFGSYELDYIGGIAGLNVGFEITEENVKTFTNYQQTNIHYRPGTIGNCTTAAGSSVMGRSYVGGIAGYNMRNGILEGNESSANVTASGNAEKGIAYVGGTVGCNSGWLAIAEDGAKEARTVSADQGAGVGGIAGINRKEGKIYVKVTGSGTGTGTTGSGFGTAQDTASPGAEIVVVGEKVTVRGRLKVGGIVGINQGGLSAEDLGPDSQKKGTTDSLPYLVCKAEEVKAYSGYAGGIAGEAEGSISRAANRSKKVTADQGPAGGIVAVNGEKVTISQCRNYGDVNADQGYAGGIAARNYGTIADCKVGYDDPGEGSLTISSEGTDAIGAVCAVNYAKGDERENGGEGSEASPVGENALIYASTPLNGVSLSGSAEKAGGIAGINRGIVGKTGKENETLLTCMPEINGKSSTRRTVGGAVGENAGVAGSTETEGKKEGTIQNVTAQGINFDNFVNYRFLGGIVGRNMAWGEVIQCSYNNGIIYQAAGNAAAGDCYGGIAGENSGDLRDCSIRSVKIDIRGGVYTATSTSTAEEKEALSTHVGGICGKNERYDDTDEENGQTVAVCGRIVGCVIEAAGFGENNKTTIDVFNGMAGGIAGYNKGEIALSGDFETVLSAMLENGIGEEGRISSAEKVKTVDKLKIAGYSADSDYVAWSETDTELESFQYAGSRAEVNQGRDVSIILASGMDQKRGNGNVGGITAYNAPTGSVNHCGTGDWYLNNKSSAIGVGTGGIIGMNESEQNLSYLLNRAFVGRQIGSGDTNCFAGGIIGNQNNTTQSEWKIENCVNYGTVYCLNTHYSGGILGQWTGTGGTLEHCYNYGNLQTTFERGWLGAAGGIVAQLYHAHEGNYYNIVSCGNYGNIYGRDGKDRKKAIYKDDKVERWVINNCANDSAGILGNITAYEAKSAEAAPHFTVQVLDCVNGSGVEIYSTSMASGIVGFVSCDNAGGPNQISIATGNIDLRIERCRNFAAVLEGGSNAFSAGIFGDRYGKFEGGKKTVIKDCYSVNPQAGRDTSGYHYYDIGYPIISYRNKEDNGSKPGTVTAERNYFLEDGKEGENSFVNGSRNNNYVMKDDSSTNRGQTWSRTYTALKDPVGRVRANRAYKVQGTSGRYYVITVDQGEKFGSDCTIQADGKVMNQKNRQIGQVLFDTDTVNFSQLYTAGNVNSVMVRNSEFDRYVRLSYHRIEGAEEEAGGRRMPKPSVSLEHSSGSSQVTVKVTPGVTSEGASEPFKYVATLYKGDRIIKENFTFYSEEAAFEIAPEDAGETGEAWKIEVTAYSMYDDVAPSETAISTGSPIVEKVLPNPDIRIELVENPAGSYTYRYQLQNIADYGQYANQYDVYVKFMDAAGTGSAEIKLGDNGEITRDQDTSSLQQLIVQARAKEAFTNGLLPSAEVSVPVYLPGNEKLAGGNRNQYHPSIPLKGNAKATYDVRGTNLSDVTITVTLDATDSGTITTPPVYRVELIGSWGTGDKKVEEAVLAYQDVLAAANGTASAVFSNLDQYDYIADAENLQVRMWYAQPGLGPVYTWHPVSVKEDGTPSEPANVRILIGVETETAEDGSETLVPKWNYEYSTVLDQKDKGKTFENYVWTSGTTPATEKGIFTWLPKPELMEQKDLKPEYSDPDNELYYIFEWDKDSGQDNEYKISLAGISNGKRVTLVSKEVKGNTYKVPAEDWNYSEVELTVTRLGDAGKGTVGLSSTKTYAVASRLPRPGQPIVTNTDVNEMLYRIEWSPITPETGCASYQIYMRFYQTDGNLSDPVKIGDPVPVPDPGSGNPVNRYVQSDINLDSYRKGDLAGAKSALVYIVAQAAAGTDGTVPMPGYVNSLPGITYELQIPSRIKTPTVDWNYNWIGDSGQPDKSNPLSVEAFRENGMEVTVTPRAGTESIPPGGSAYLLAAWVVDDTDIGAVKQVIGDINSAGSEGAGKLPELSGIPGLRTVYPAGAEGIVPVQMDVDASQVYHHSLNGLSAEYAGKYIFFCTRISSGNGQFSSAWVASDLVRLPYVRLSDPVVTGEVRTRETVVATYTNPDLPDVNVKENWNVSHIGFRWNSVDYADTYYVNITPGTKDGDPAPPMELKIVEESTGDGGAAVLRAYVKQDDGSWQELGRNTVDGIISFDSGYSRELKGKYEKSDGVTVLYKGMLSASIEAVQDENGKYVYTLILPDAGDLVTGDGVVITGDDLRNTKSVAVRADVRENESEAGSGAYVGSNTVENQIGN